MINNIDNKIVFVTRFGNLKIGDFCESVTYPENKGIFIAINTSDTSTPFRIKLRDRDNTIVSCENIRPIQKPIPLDGIPLYNKLMQLGIKCYSFRRVTSTTIYPIIGSFSLDGKTVNVLGTSIRNVTIGLANSPEDWILVSEITEEYGK